MEETEILETETLQKIVIVVEVLQNLPIEIEGLMIGEIKQWSSKIIDINYHLVDKKNQLDHFEKAIKIKALLVQG